MKIIATRPDGARILRIESPEEAAPYVASFAGTYQDIFSEPPYNERFYPNEAQGVLSSFLAVPENVTLLAVKGEFTVVGFGIGVPAASRPDIARELRGLLPVGHTWYLAELGVLGSWRSRGLGRELVRHRLELIDRQRYTHAVLRASAVRNASYEMYLSLGFDDIGVYMEVPARRVDGSVSTDRRLFLSKVLSAEDVGESQDARAEVGSGQS